jgi:SAM-dependent methyltransferase
MKIGESIEHGGVPNGPDNELLPSDELIQKVGIGPRNGQEFIGFGDYIFESNIRTDAKLQPNEKLLDLGCGLGQVARPLTKYLSGGGRYEGLDVNSDAIRWCKEHYARFPNFNFQLADLYNSTYNPQGAYKASEYKFPYGSGAFDVVFLRSVFTHLLPDEVRNYLGEIARVTKPGGRCVITYFLLNAEALRSIERGLIKSLTFLYEYDSVCRIENRESPGDAVGLSESFVRELYDQHGMSITRIDYGQWCRLKFLEYDQDTIIAVKQ